MISGRAAEALARLGPRAARWLGRRLIGPFSLLLCVFRLTLGRRATLIAVTGSFGKTRSARALGAILGDPTDLERVPNAGGGLLLRALEQMWRRRMAVIEIAIGQPREMRRYARAIRPQIAVVTRVGWEHGAYFPDGLTEVRTEKAELVSALPPNGFAILNRDDEHVMWMARKTKAKVVTFGHHPDADFAIAAIEPEPSGTRIVIRTGGVEHSVHTALIGNVAAMPLAAAIAAAVAAGIDIRRAIRAIERLPPSTRRLEPVRLKSGATALLDDQQGAPAAALAAFDAVASLPHGQHIAVLGNIPKTREPMEPIYRGLGRRAGEVFDRILFIHLADEPYELYREAAIEGGIAPDRISRTSSVREAAEILRNELRAEDTLLLKGHFTDHLSRIAMQLQGIEVGCRLRSCTIRSRDWCNRCPLVSNDLA